MLELRPLVTFPPGVLGTDIDGEDFVRLEQSSECVLRKGLFVPALSPFSPGTVLHLGQFVDDPF
jgi:hypothetical protein